MAVIGIDLGTTNSLGCVYRNGKAELIPNAYGSYLTPSVVSMTEDGKLIVGQPAKDRLITHPERTVSSFKKDMGTGRSWKPGEKSFLPEELSSLVIRSIVEDAQNYLGEEIEEAVISVPAYFHDEQRVAVKRAGALAGIHVERIVNEPSAAALASYFTANEEQNMLVFDFGGGTLDVSLVDCFDTMVEIVSVAGNNRLGGDDFDRLIAEHFLREHGVARQQLRAQEYAVLLKQAERCKKLLSEQEEVVMHAMVGDQVYESTYTMDRLFEESKALLKEIRQVIGRALKDGKMTIHVSLVSKNIVNLFEGTSEDAQKDGAELLEPTTDTVTYSDGATEEVYGFDIPVPELDKEFDVALIGTKGVWYDHKVSVTNPVKVEE